MGDAEFFDVVTLAPDVVDHTLINAGLPEELCIKKSSLLDKKPVSLFDTVVASRYIFIPVDSVSAGLLSEAVETLLSKKSIEITVEKKGKSVSVDLKPLIYELEMKENKNTSYIEAVLSARPSKTCRPVDLISCLFPGKGFGDFLIKRTECLKDDNDLLTKMEAIN